MKKFSLGLILILIPIILAGCSIGGSDAGKSASGEPVANPSNTIWTSVDAGKKWINNSKTTEVSIAGLDVVSMLTNPNDENNVYVGTLKSGIFVTKNGGENWEKLALAPEKVYGLVFDPTDTNTIYASGITNKRGKIFKSIDAGVNWTMLYAIASDGPLVSALAVDKNNPKIIYAAMSDNQLIKTYDGGNSWQNIFTTKSPVIKIVFDRGSSDLFYGMSLGGDILRSRDAGKSIEYLKTLNMNNGGADFDALEVDPNSNGVLYVGGKNGIHVSRNAGDNWDEIKTLNSPKTYPVRAIAINPTNSKEIIYGAAQASYRSLDGGNTWEAFQFTVGKNVSIIKYSKNPNRLYLGFRK